MIRYKNKRLNSGVKAYCFGYDYIIVEFDGTYYLYSYKVPGIREVNEIKKKAEDGEKLSDYISKYIRKRYEKRCNSLKEMENYLEERLINS
jgi:hypothetical protein